jgi:hypothetical protein
VDKVKTVAWVSMVTSIILAASLIGVYLNLGNMIQQQSDIVEEQGYQIQTYENITNEMGKQITELQIRAIENAAKITFQQDQINNLTSDMDYFRLPD